MRSTKLIMITNDDGIDAPGLRTAYEAVRDLGDTWVVGPKHEYSSCSHSVTLLKPIFCTKLAPRRYAIEGTPADTVFVACSDILPRLPDLVVSGVNAGPNLGKDAFYSGTIAAAREAAFRGIPSVAVSLQRGGRLEEARRIVRMIARAVLGGRRWKAPLILNVNVPTGRPKGLRLTRLGRRMYQDHVIRRTSPRKQRYYWINGGEARVPPGRGSDGEALARGYVSITPLGLDQTGGGLAEGKWRSFLEDLERLWTDLAV
jgi:5'-nucleotidase